MKTIYTDRLGVMAWLMMFAAIVHFIFAYQAFERGDGNGLAISFGLGVFFAFLAAKRAWDVRVAKHEGRDHTVLRIKND